jgi:hypothetical protein
MNESQKRKKVLEIRDEMFKDKGFKPRVFFKENAGGYNYSHVRYGWGYGGDVNKKRHFAYIGLKESDRGIVSTSAHEFGHIIDDDNAMKKLSPHNYNDKMVRELKYKKNFAGTKKHVDYERRANTYSKKYTDTLPLDEKKYHNWDRRVQVEVRKTPHDDEQIKGGWHVKFRRGK